MDKIIVVRNGFEEFCCKLWELLLVRLNWCCNGVCGKKVEGLKVINFKKLLCCKYLFYVIDFYENFIIGNV